jgi:hypothetical protein
VENLSWWACSAVVFSLFFCPNMIAMAVGNYRLSTEYLISVEHSAGEPRLPYTALEKPLSELLLPGVICWTHCLNSFPHDMVAAVADA